MDFWTLLKQALFVRSTQKGSYLIPGFFLLLCALIFPYGLNTAPDALPFLAPGVIWMCALLGCLSGMQTLFRDDYLDGSLELFKASGVLSSLWIVSRIIAFWIFNTVALIAAAWLVCIFYNIPTSNIALCLLPIALGLLSLSLLGGISSAITVSSATTSALVSLLALPLAIPVLIFGSQASLNAVHGDSILNEIEVLIALAFIYAPLCIGLSTLALNSALEEK